MLFKINCATISYRVNLEIFTNLFECHIKIAKYFSDLCLCLKKYSRMF